MENYTIENEFDNSIQKLPNDDSEQNDLISIFEGHSINENFSNGLFNDEDIINIYYIKKKNYNNPLELSINNVYTEPDSNKKITNKNNEIIDTSGIKNKNVINNMIMIRKKRGRKKINEKPKEKAKHTKSSEDNQIRKIKTQLFDFSVRKLNSSIKFKSGIFRPLNKKIKESLKRDENMQLLNRTIGDIFANTKMNKISEKKGKSNKKLIEKIYDENIEKETIKILSMSFKDFLNEIRDNCLEEFLEIIKEKEIKIQKKIITNGDFKIESYMKVIKKLLIHYEKWFEDKKGRNKREKKINISIF